MRKLFNYVILLVISSMFVMCSDDDCTHDPNDPHITLVQTVYNLDRVGSAEVIVVSTNIDKVTCSVEEADWCIANLEGDKLTISASVNPDKESREAKVFLRGENVEACIIVTQDGRTTGLEDLKDDIRLTVKSGEASSFQTGEGIEKSFDGDLSTMYHSAWKNSATDYFPITLTYNFENAEALDYLIYHPRQSGSNGLFKELEIWVATESNPTLTKYGDYDFKGNSTATKVTFEKTIQKPIQVQFVVKSGAGDGQGFASCAEMEFYRKNPDSFDYLSIFTDHTCSVLKADMTEEKIDEIGNAFFRNLAKEIFLDKYEKEFRVQTYNSWQHPDIKASENKTRQYGLRDNPTGIYITQDEELVVFMDQTDSEDVALFIQDPENKISGSSFPLSVGLNKFKAKHDGLIYIMYYTKKGTEAPIKINIATGVVNGYFDSQKHKGSDWERLISEATFKHFDLVGKHAIMTFETEAYRKYTPDGLALINAYDEMVALEQDFMGLNKYERVYPNRAYFLGIYESYMYASDYYTAYNVDTQKDILDINKFRTTEVWGPAHELGHIHQTRPGLRWAGMTEVTNNIHSLYVQTQFGNVSRLQSGDTYKKAKAEIINKKMAHNACEDVFYKLVPFWQLKLYLQDAQGITDFYKDVYEAVRVKPNPSTQGQCQIEFVKIVCEVAKLDLTDFFEKWGFLTPINIEIDDYGKSQFVVTQAMIDACKTSIKEKNYPKPNHDNIYDITDDTVNDFK